MSKKTFFSQSMVWGILFLMSAAYTVYYYRALLPLTQATFDFRPVRGYHMAAAPLLYLSGAAFAAGLVMQWANRSISLAVRRVALTAGLGCLVVYLFLLVQTGFLTSSDPLVLRLLLNPALFMVPGMLIAIGLSNRRQ